MALQMTSLSDSVVATLMIMQIPTQLSPLSLRNLTPPISLPPYLGTMSPGVVVLSVKASPLRHWALPPLLSSTGKALVMQMLSTIRTAHGLYRTFERP